MNIAKLKDIIHTQNNSLREKLQRVCQYVHDNEEKYTWVGFYFMNNAQRTLHLGPYVGLPTEHHIIPYGKGICGQVAESGQYFLSNNVADEDNYIACSMDVKSEIVVPLYLNNTLVAQLDIDSNLPDAFNESDTKNLESLCHYIGQAYGSQLEELQKQVIISATQN